MRSRRTYKGQAGLRLTYTNLQLAEVLTLQTSSINPKDAT